MLKHTKMSEYLYDPNEKDFPSRLLADCPELSELKIDNIEQVLKYVVTMYDLGSEYRELYPDLPTRKRECARNAGFKLEKGTNKFDSDTENMLVGENSAVVSAIMCYIKLQTNPEYMLYISFNEMLAVEVKNSLSEKDPKIIKVTRENIAKLGGAIAMNERNIFSGAETKSMRKALYLTLVVEGSILRPESVAKMISEGKLALGDDPYYSR